MQLQGLAETVIRWKETYPRSQHREVFESQLSAAFIVYEYFLRAFDRLCIHAGQTGPLIEMWEPRWRLWEVMGSKAIRANQLWNTNRNLYSPTLHPLGQTTLIDLITLPCFNQGKWGESQMSWNWGILDLWKSKPHVRQDSKWHLDI